MAFNFIPTNEIILSNTSPISPFSPISSISSISSISPYNMWGPYNTLDPYAFSATSEIILSPTSPLSPTVIVPNQPIITSVNLTYSKPLLGLYQDLNSDPRTRNEIVKYFHKLALDNWLLGDLIDIINYFKIDDKGNVDLINDMKDYKSDSYKKYSVDQLEKIVDFIERYFLTQRVMRRLLERYSEETETEWVHLHRNKYFIRQLVGDKLLKLIKEAFEEKAKFRK